MNGKKIFETCKLNNIDLFEYFRLFQKERYISFDEEMEAEEITCYVDILRLFLKPYRATEKISRISKKVNGRIIDVKFSFNDKEYKAKFDHDFTSLDQSIFSFIKGVIAENTDDIVHTDIADDWSTHILIREVTYQSTDWSLLNQELSIVTKEVKVLTDTALCGVWESTGTVEHSYEGIFSHDTLANPADRIEISRPDDRSIEIRYKMLYSRYLFGFENRVHLEFPSNQLEELTFRAPEVEVEVDADLSRVLKGCDVCIALIDEELDLRVFFNNIHMSTTTFSMEPDGAKF